MTISPSALPLTYLLDGVETEFDLPFWFPDAAALGVRRISTDNTETLLALPADYTISGANNDDGGTLTLASPGTSGHKLQIYWDADAVQQLMLQTNAALPAKSLETAYDYLTILMQQVLENLSRCPQIPRAESGLTATMLARKAQRLGNVFGFDPVTGAPTLFAVPGAVIAAGSITATLLAAAAVTTTKIADGAVTLAKLDAGVLSSLTLADGSVTTAKILDANVTKPKLSSGLQNSLCPIASIMDYAGTAAPGGWLFCYGQAISRTTYADLFAAIGTTYGVGDGSTTFNLPDLRGRVVAGKDDMGGSSADRLTDVLAGGLNGDVLGDTGGAEGHQLTVAELAAHHHNYNMVRAFDSSGANTNQTIGKGNPPGTAPVTNNATGSILDTGGDTAHNNVQPTIILNKIIRVFNGS